VTRPRVHSNEEKVDVTQPHHRLELRLCYRTFNADRGGLFLLNSPRAAGLARILLFMGANSPRVELIEHLGELRGGRLGSDPSRDDGAREIDDDYSAVSSPDRRQHVSKMRGKRAS
jgi:hypothetical protein